MKDKKGANSRNSILNVVYIFIGLFIIMMGYFVYFLVVRGNEVINNSYNKRQDVLAQRVIRGMIVSSDGEILARTIIDQEGREIREYPFGDMYAQVVGRVVQGMSGLEESENIRLLTSDRNPIVNMYNDMVGKKNPGNNCITTLDSRLQKVAYDALGDNRGAVVVMEPSTGKILAMVSKPSYDSNKIDELWSELIEDKEDESPLMNRATQGLYPPGSTFKLLTALEYIRENPDYIEYSYDCEGEIEYNGMVIHCVNNKVHGKVDLMKSFAKSCNASFSYIGQGLNIDSFNSLCEDFYFNKDLPIAMAASKSSFELNSDSYSVKEAMQTSIGQGRTLITPLNNAMIAAAVANDGIMMKPYVVDRILDADNKIVKRITPQEISQPMTEEEAAYLSALMQEVVNNGTGDELLECSVSVAGKTGSAEQNGKPAHAWFIGYAPADNPQIAISVIIESKGSGSKYAVPVAKELINAYFK